MKKIRGIMAIFICFIMTLSVFGAIMADEQCTLNDIVVSQEITEIETHGKATVDDFTIEEGVGFVYIALKASGQEAKATKQNKEAKEAKNNEGKIYVHGKISLENGAITEVVMDQGKDGPDKQGDGDFKKNSPMQDEVFYTINGTEVEFHMTAAGSDKDGFKVYYKDTKAPETEIVNAPNSPINQKDLEIKVRSDECDVTFMYNLNGDEYVAVEGDTIKLTELEEGDYELTVKAVDAAGNEDATPAVYTFTIEQLNMGLEFVRDFKFQWGNDAQRNCHSLATRTTDGSTPTEFYCGGGHSSISYLLYRIDALGNVLGARIHNTYPEAIDYDPYTDTIWTGEPYGGNGAAIYEVDPVTLRTKWIHTGTGPVIGLAILDRTKIIYVNTNGSVWLWDRGVGTKTPLFPHGTLAQNCGFDDDVASLDIVGGKLYWTPHSRNRDYVCVTDLEGNHLMNMDIGKTGLGMGTINVHPEYTGDLDSFYLATHSSGDKVHWEQYIVT